MDKEAIDATKPIVAMICATFIAAWALYTGVDGTLIAAMCGLIGTLGGYTAGIKRS